MCVGDKWNHADNIKELRSAAFTKVSLQKYQGKYRGL